MNNDATLSNQPAIIGLEAPPEPLASPAEQQGSPDAPREAKRTRVQDSDLVTFLWNVHQYTNEYIRFADTKAAVIIVFDCSLIAALYAAHVHQRLSAAFDNCSIQAGASAAAFGLLSLGIAMAAAVILPRLWNSQAAGLIFWEGIRSYGSPSRYWMALQETTCLSQEIADHLFALAGVAARKYWYTKWSLFLSAAGVIFASGLLIFT